MWFVRRRNTMNAYSSLSRDLEYGRARRAREDELLLTRAGAQIDFANYLAGGNRDWRELVDEAVAVAKNSKADPGGIVERVEHLLAPLSAAAKKRTIYCVGHAHIDMNWQWSWPETVSVTIDSVTTVLKLFDRYDSFVFSQSQASVYRILERFRPDLLDRVTELVKSGRWEVTASHWVEAEKNIVSGESLCRHLLYTRAYMHELFGLEVDSVPIDWSPDTFGHPATVPTYLADGGVRYLYVHRPGAHGDQPVPGVFTWRGPDDSEVLVRNDMVNGYNGIVAPSMVESTLLSMADFGLDYSMFVYGVGDHGGGPTVRDIERIIEMQKWPIFPTIEFSKSLDFFRRLDSDQSLIPVRSEELNFEFTGCYTTQTLIKRGNRLSEDALIRAEQTDLFANLLTGVETKNSLLADSWERTLFNHFHDILPGSGVRATRTHAHAMFQETVAATGAIETEAQRSIADNIDTSGLIREHSVGEPLLGFYAGRSLGAGVGHGSGEGDSSGYSAVDTRGHPLVLFNSSQLVQSGPVEAVIWDPGWDDTVPNELIAESADGDTTDAQVLESGVYWGHRFVRVAFPANVPAFGYTTVLLREVTLEDGEIGEGGAGSAAAGQMGLSHVCSYASYERGGEGIENEFLSVEIDPEGGGIASITDRRRGTRMRFNCAGLQYALEQGGIMSAWKIGHFSEIASPQLLALERTADGPIVVSIECRFRIENSDATVRYTLKSNDPLLYIHIDMTWFERGSEATGVPSARFILPFDPISATVDYEIPFGSIERDMPNGEEVPAYGWASVRGAFEETLAPKESPAERACVLFTDSKHGFSYRNNTLGLTLIRSSYEPDNLPDIGDHEINLAIALYDAQNGLPTEEIIRRARCFTNPVTPTSTGVHSGSIPATASLIDINQIEERPVPVVSAIKRSEKDGSPIVRLYNPREIYAGARMTTPDELGELVGVEKIDLLERIVEETSSITVKNNSFEIEIEPRKIATYKLTLTSR